MAKAKDADDTAGVDAFMAALDHPLKSEVETLRGLIKRASPMLLERVKWNAPSYFLGKDDFAAFNLHNREFVQLIVVFPKGKSAIDIDGLTEGEWVDRRMVKFTDAADIEWKANKLTKPVRAWVALVADKA